MAGPAVCYFILHCMKSLLVTVLAAVGCVSTGCVHTPPGTSVEVALAKKAELHRLRQPPPRARAVARAKPKKKARPLAGTVHLVAEAFARGQFCMKAGKDEEAIAAFEETVKLDPNCQDAWKCLAILYEKRGQEKKALEAFRKSKQTARG